MARAFAIRRYTDFKKPVLESLLMIFKDAGVPLKNALYWSIGTQEHKQVLKEWIEKGFEGFASAPSRTLIRSLLINTRFDTGHLQQAAKVLFEQTEAEEFETSILKQQQRLGMLILTISGRKVSPQDDQTIKDLLLSPNLSIRRQVQGKIQEYLQNDFERASKEYGADAADTFHEYVNRYNWLRPGAGLDKLRRNVKVIIQNRDSYLYWLRMDPQLKKILQTIKRMESDGKDNQQINDFLITRGYSRNEIAQARNAGEVSLDADRSVDGNGFTLYDVIASAEDEDSLADEPEEAPLEGRIVNVNIWGVADMIEADTIGQALRSFWTKHKDLKDGSSRIWDAIQKGECIISINGTEVDLPLVLEKPLGENADLLIVLPSEETSNGEEKDPTVLVSGDEAMLGRKGGIDLTSDKMPLQIQNRGGEIKFHIDPAMLGRMQNAPGFVPVIINIQPMNDLRLFLGVEN